MFVLLPTAGTFRARYSLLPWQFRRGMPTTMSIAGGCFTCNTSAPNKTFIEAECFDKYGQDYVDSFLLIAFVRLYVLLLLVITAYTVFAARYVFAVEEQKNDPNRLQECRQSFKSTSSVLIFYVL